MLKQLAAELLTLYHNDTPTIFLYECISFASKPRASLSLTAMHVSSFYFNTIVCWLHVSLLQVSN